jgi:hypothetical protein
MYKIKPLHSKGELKENILGNIPEITMSLFASASTCLNDTGIVFSVPIII